MRLRGPQTLLDQTSPAPYKQEVGGSIPSPPMMFCPVPGIEFQVRDGPRLDVSYGRHHFSCEQRKLIRETGKAGDAQPRPALNEVRIDEAERNVVVPPAAQRRRVCGRSSPRTPTRSIATTRLRTQCA